MAEATAHRAGPPDRDRGLVKAVVELRTMVAWAVGLLWALLGLVAFVFLMGLMAGTLRIEFGGIIMIVLVGVVVGGLAAARRAIEALAVAAGAELPVSEDVGAPPPFMDIMDAAVPSPAIARPPHRRQEWSPVSRARRVSLPRRRRASSTHE